MSGVTDPLDIAFYAADGEPREPAAHGAVPRQGGAQCPVYRADGPFLYAVETLTGGLPPGPVDRLLAGLSRSLDSTCWCIPVTPLA